MKKVGYDTGFDGKRKWVDGIGKDNCASVLVMPLDRLPRPAITREIMLWAA